MTLNKIEQRLDALQAEKDKLTAELERLKAEEEHKKAKPWRAYEDGRYYAIDADGEILELGEHFGKDCNEMFSRGNYYRTEALAEQDAKELALRGKIRQLRDALCEGYQFTTGSTNYFLCYDTFTKWFFVSTSKIRRNVGDIYFDTREHAQQACDILNAEWSAVHESNRKPNSLR